MVIFVLLVGYIGGISGSVITDEEEEDGPEGNLQDGARPSELGLTRLLTHFHWWR